MIELRDIEARKSGHQLFRHFSWKIQEGEHWLITGANGSGKTTLLEIIQGLIHIPSGTVHMSFIEGSTWDERYKNRRQLVHYVPTHAITALLKQQEGLYYQQRYYGIGDERIPLVRDLLSGDVDFKELHIPESFSVRHLLDLELTRLSNGQLKKVLLTKVMLSGIPRLLMLDYPFEGLDHQSRNELCDFIDFIALHFGTHIVIVDHHHHLPKVINRKLILDDFSIVSEEQFIASETVPNVVTAEASHKAPNDSDVLIDIRNLKIQYGEHVVIQNFNWTVHKGERWALIGRNGSGKTTLFGMIFADHPQAYSQEIYLFGRRRGTGESIWDIKKRINYLGPELMSYLSPQHMLMSGSEFLKNIKDSSPGKFDQLVREFQAESFLDLPVRFLSSGQLQLLLIMSCFLKTAELLLLDEPFQFLDDRQKSNLTKYLRSHLNPESTLILITHYEADLREWTDLTKRI